MKFPFFKTLLLTGALLLAWNCTDSTSVPMDALSGDSQYVWVIDIGPNNSIYIAENGSVYDSQWNIIGTYTEGNIVTNEGELFLTDVDVTDRPQAKIVETNGGEKMVEFDDGTVKDIQGNDIGTVDNSGNVVDDNGKIVAENPNKPAGSSASGTSPTSTTSNPGNNNATDTSSNSNGNNNSGNNDPASSATQTNGECNNGKCFDAPTGSCVDMYKNYLGPHEEQYAYHGSCELKCWYDPNNKDCKDMGGGSVTPSSSGSQQPKSSSSKQQTQSSSSKQQTQSSSSKANTNTGDEAKYLNAGAGGQEGYATRYWDCCMPHCAQPDHGGSARTCNADGSTRIANNSTKSICAGGEGTACKSQMPIIVSDKLAYAFAATPGNGDNTCGKCFALTFTGEGFYETKSNHRALLGKTLVVKASNIGYDVANNQFDIMIPGGGFGAFNGCSRMGWNIPNNTEQYGGLLSDCEKEVNYAEGDARKNCLTKKCNSVFANDNQAKQGCLFLATWMEAAGNPKHRFKQVDCPKALDDAY